VVEEASALEVVQEAREGLVDGAGARAVAGLQLAVGVPCAAALGGAAVDLDDSDAAFDESAGEEAFSAGVFGVGVVEAVEFARFFGFGSEVDGFGHFGLHAQGEVVGGHSRAQGGVVFPVFEVLGVELAEEVDAVLLRAEWEVGRGVEVEDGGGAASEVGALVGGG
jgi:hypothetical protein